MANLFTTNYREQVGVHFVGPQWAHNDGSRVKASVTSQASPPQPYNLPWLLLDANENRGGPDGTFTETEKIQRALTLGGVAPTYCGPSSPRTLTVKYSTLYIFYADRFDD